MNRIALLFAVLMSSPLASQAVELGGGYNEQISDINHALIAKSGVRWVRAYVNVPRNYLIYANPPDSDPPNPITGIVERNLFQSLDHVSSDADVLAVAAVDKLIDTKAVMVDCRPTKIILSLKHDFTYPYKPPHGRVPSTIDEWGNLLTAIETLLTTKDRGKNIDILVVGNEPMFEVQPNTDQETADNYAAYLNFLIGNLHELKNDNGWTFEIFVGALNRPSSLTSPVNTIVPAVLSVLHDNPQLVAGIDLHEHVMDPTEVSLDIELVKHFLQPNQKIISTEFSLIELWKDRVGKPLGPWGKKHGYKENTLLYEWINDLIKKAATGKPVSQEYFMSYFNAQSWYPKHWFKTMLDIFEEEGVYAVTYGLEETPRYPWEANELDQDAVPWILNGVYNGTILGTGKDGYYTANPLVFPDFRAAIEKLRPHMPGKACSAN